jgi:hypothetical protein
MDKPKTTPKDFFLWVGAMISLYASVFAFISLVFSYINYAFPDPLRYYSSNPYEGGAAYAMASLIVLVPVFLVLMRVIHGTIVKDPSRGDIWVRRWALYLVLFVAGATIIGDLITLLNTFFRGDELSVRFLLKVALVLLVAGAGFLHFLADLRGYWEKNPDKSKMVSIGVGILVLVTIIAGFFIIGSPREARLYRYDEQKINDLQNIQWQVVNYWQQKQKLPENLSELNDPISGFVLPKDPESKEDYRYEATGPMSFKLCAAFNTELRGDDAKRRSAVSPMEYGLPAATWEHGKGETCFDRTIDPDRYPSLKKVM